MGKAKLPGSGRSSIVDAVIDRFYAESKDIDAMTFVNFINHYNVKYNDTSDYSENHFTKGIYGVGLDSNRVLLYLADGNEAGSLVVLYFDHNTKTITHGVNSAMGTTKGSSIIKVSSTKFLFFYFPSTSTNVRLTCKVGTINTSTNKITFGSAITICDKYTYSGDISMYQVCELSSGKFMVRVSAQASSGDVSQQSYGRVFTVSGTSITLGNLTQLSTATYQLSVLLQKLTSSKVLSVRQNNASADKKIAEVYTISGTTITKESENDLGLGQVNIKSSVPVNSNAVAAFYTNNSKGLYGMILSVNANNLVEVSSSTLLVPESITPQLYNLNVSHLNSNLHVLGFLFNDGSSINSYMCIIKITSERVGLELMQKLASNVYNLGFCMVAVLSPKILISAAVLSSYTAVDLGYVDLAISTKVNGAYASTDTIEGLALSSCTTTKNGRVAYLP